LKVCHTGMAALSFFHPFSFSLYWRPAVSFHRHFFTNAQTGPVRAVRKIPPPFSAAIQPPPPPPPTTPSLFGVRIQRRYFFIFLLFFPSFPSQVLPHPREGFLRHRSLCRNPAVRPLPMSLGPPLFLCFFFPLTDF